MMTQLHWLSPCYIWTLPLLLIVLLILLYRTIVQCKIARTIVADRYQSALLAHFSVAKKIMKACLFFVGTLFLWLALARLAGYEQQVIIGQEGRDVFIALDISRSMLVQDRAPNRLNFAKQKIKQLINSLQAERVGLIVFSGSTFVQCPLTSDYGAFSMYLDQLDVETISSGTTALDQAIVSALTAFQSVGERKNKLLVLFTDGEDFSSNLAGIKKRAQKEGLHIFTVGVGTPEGGPIPLYDAKGNQVGHQKDQQGAVVISRLNEGILHNLAQDSGGQYVTASDTAKDIKKIVASITAFEKEQLDDRSFKQVTEYYHYFLAASFICFALEWLL